MGALEDALMTGPPAPAQPAAPAAQPAQQGPDMSGGLPFTDAPAPNGGALSTALAPDLPKFHRTFMNTLKGIALGFMQGNIPGAIQGGIDPQVPVKYQQQQRQIMNAQTADVLTKARINEINLQNLPQQIRDEHDKLVLEQVKQLGSPDESFDNSSDAAQEALQKHVANGNVPLAHVLSDSHTTYVYYADKAAQSSAAYDAVRKAGVLNGNPTLSGITEQQFAALDPKERASLWTQAQQTLSPVAPSVDEKTRQGQILAAKRQLQTVQNYSNLSDPDKKQLVSIAQNNLDILTQADNDPTFADKVDENQRQQFLQGIQNSNLPADLKKTYTNFINQAKRGSDFSKAVNTVTQDIGKYQTGVDSARQKAADTAAAGGQEWKPKVTADEKKKAELAENIAFNANEINSLLAKRPDIVGSVAGRFTNTEQMVGNNDQDISALGMAVHNTAMANNGVHGLRSAEEVQRTEQKILNNFKNGPQAVKGALNEITGSVQTFIDNARPATYATHSEKGGAAQYFANKQQAQQQERAVYAKDGTTIIGYTTDGKTMRPTQ